MSWFFCVPLADIRRNRPDYAGAIEQFETWLKEHQEKEPSGPLDK
ncbi:MAG TPA: hypothetical protein P5279_08755 [Anaerohalosphaeraceae bacterium]|jgi:hypothetical protein|nr:hypothetical protein [Anaerohalosphaeraceae bacterium]HRT50568.1 hypothetical protein [Anaerohalosphaeraceae bacterium]HRT86492.1 hypothetical protein [Anaerohalosphaeraceae bacterium]